MPKALKAHPGERLDLPDYVQGANTYTQETQKFLLEREWADRRSRVLDGFRIRVEDQGLNPGLITVFNGNAVDRNGQLVNNEDSPNDSRSLTLLGANLNFYIEIEFSDVISDTDARFFWDPTIPNTAPEPDGSEFALNVATRITPDWRVVNPVSTTGFQQTSNPNSIRVPVGAFRTNGANQITGGSNPGLTLVRAASVLEADIAIGVAALRVVDARIFPATTPFNITVDFGAASPEARVVTAVDRKNGILTLSVATAFAHQAGAVIRVTSGTAELAAERVDPSNPTLDPSLPIPGSPDPAQRLWQANELRGSGLMQSKETFGSRDDLNLRSLKDQIDFLSAQIREMKFGHPRPDTTNAAPPATFATRPRYFDRAGSIQGARSNTVSIGNGTTTFGDFNGTTDAVFTAAISALPVSGGIVFVKSGTYTFAVTVLLGKQVTFVGEGAGTVNIVNNVPAGPAFTATTNVDFRNVTLSKAAGGFASCIDLAASIILTLEYCVVNTAIRVNGAFNGAVRATKTAFTPSTAVSCISTTGGGILANSSFIECAFVSAFSAFGCAMNLVTLNTCFIFAGIGFFAPGATDTIQNFTVTRCNITVASSVFFSSGTQVITSCAFRDCQLTAVSLAADGAMFLFTSTGALSNFAVTDSTILVTGVGAQTEAAPGAVIRITALGTVSNVRLDRNSITVPVASYMIPLLSDCQNTLLPVVVTGNHVFRTAELVRLGSTLNQMASGDYRVFDNFHDNAGASIICYGVRLFQEPSASHVHVARNTFTNYTNPGVGERVGVDATWDTVGGVDVLVEGNIFATFGGADTAVGVAFRNIATSPASGRVRVKNNEFQFISANGLYSAGARLEPTFLGNLIEFEVSGNSMTSIGAALASTSAYGVYMEAVSRGAVVNNQIVSVVSTNIAGEGVAVKLNTCGFAGAASGVLVANNRLFVATSQVGVPLGLAGALIKVIGSSQNINISHNICSQLGVVIGGTVTDHIMVFTDTCRGVQIVGNRVQTAFSGGLAGILVSRDASTAAAIEDVFIANNNIEMNSTTSWRGIDVRLGGNSSGVSVESNVIREGTIFSSHFGISVAGHDNPVQTRGVAVNNNVLSGVKVGALTTGRVGIIFNDCRLSSLTNNLVDWNEPAIAEGIGISVGSVLLGSWRQFLVAGNLVRSDNNLFTFDIVLQVANMLDGLLDSNIVGDSVNIGVVVPLFPAGGWTYGTNKLS